MITAINMLQNERDLMREAEAKIRNALATESPGKAAADILRDFSSLSLESERAAFVAVLATSVAIRSFAP
jgi:hypothetical protein